LGRLVPVGGVALVSMFVIVLSVLVRGPTVDVSLRGSDENVFSFMKPRVFEAIGVISFAVCPSPSPFVALSV
jgi:sodium-coupled neutral amino acid transporter 11